MKQLRSHRRLTATVLPTINNDLSVSLSAINFDKEQLESVLSVLPIGVLQPENEFRHHYGSRLDSCILSIIRMANSSLVLGDLKDGQLKLHRSPEILGGSKCKDSRQRRKEGREHMDSIVDGIREFVEKYNSISMFSLLKTWEISNTQSSDNNLDTMKDRFFVISFVTMSSWVLLKANKVMQVSLGRSASDDIGPP
ncbi:hypothetical protein YC2023_041270 [Brassica napus]